MTGKPLRTSYPLWALAAIILFIALGFVDPVAGAAKGDNSLWSYVGHLCDGGYNTEALLTAAAYRAVLQTVPAVLLGWVLQALLVAGWAAARGWLAASKSVAPGSEK
jgi:hypothetical protein